MVLVSKLGDIGDLGVYKEKPARLGAGKGDGRGLVISKSTRVIRLDRVGIISDPIINYWYIQRDGGPRIKPL